RAGKMRSAWERFRNCWSSESATIWSDELFAGGYLASEQSREPYAARTTHGRAASLHAQSPGAEHRRPVRPFAQRAPDVAGGRIAGRREESGQNREGRSNQSRAA